MFQYAKRPQPKAAAPSQAPDAFRSYDSASSGHARQRSAEPTLEAPPAGVQRKPRCPACAAQGKTCAECADPTPPKSDLLLAAPPSGAQKKPRCPACVAHGKTCTECEESSLEDPPSGQQARSTAPHSDPAERQADEIGFQLAPRLPKVAVRSGSLPGPVRDVAERHVGEPLDHVRVDASAEGHREAQAHSALAVTSGSRISFDEDTSLLDGGVASRFVLAHELTHAAQQRRAGRGLTAGSKYGRGGRLRGSIQDRIGDVEVPRGEGQGRKES